MTKECQGPNDQKIPGDVRVAGGIFIGHWSLIRHSVICHSSFLLSLIFATGLHAADNLSVLGRRPKWSVLEHYQETITHDKFEHLLRDVYGTHGFADDFFKIDNDSAQILTNRASHNYFTLRFAKDEDSREHVPRLWRPAKSLPPANEEKPLAKLKIALDPGHLGGKWAKMEERWFRVGDSAPVKEGDLALRVARLLAPRLRALGATVSFVRSHAEPVTLKRPEDFKELARKILIKNGVPQPGTNILDPNDPEKEHTIARSEEHTSELQSRLH